MQSSARLPAMNLGQFRWPMKWYSPEVITYYVFTPECDVWSFGVSCWEAYTFGDTPWGVRFELYFMQSRFWMLLLPVLSWHRCAGWRLPGGGSAAHRASGITPPAACALPGYGLRAYARLHVFQLSERHQWPPHIRADLPAAHSNLRTFTWAYEYMIWTLKLIKSG